MRYYLGPWQWTTSPGMGDAWDAPKGAAGRLDLRPLPCNVPGHGIFALESPPIEPGYVELAGSLTAPLSLSAKTALIDGLKLPSLAATNLPDALAEILTTKADPTGAVRSMPLIPKQDGTLEIILAGDVIWARPFTGEADAAWPNIQAVLQANYRAIREQALAGGTEQHRKYLDALNAKYGIGTEKFIPDDLPAETPLPRATIRGDTFVDGDGTSLGAHTATGPNGGFGWTEVSGTWTINSNMVDSSGTDASARAEAALSGDDQYSEVVANTNGANNDLWGGATRFAAAATTYYVAFRINFGPDSMFLRKVIATAATNLANTAVTLSAPDTVRCEVDGTTLKSFYNTVEIDSVIDASISGNLLCGLMGNSDSVDFGDFEAADLGAPPAFIPYPYPRGLRGGHSVQTGGLI